MAINATTVVTKDITLNGTPVHRTECHWDLPKVIIFPITLRYDHIISSNKCYRRTFWNIDISFSPTNDGLIEIKSYLQRTDHSDVTVDNQLHIEVRDRYGKEFVMSSSSSTIPPTSDLSSNQPSWRSSLVLNMYQAEGLPFLFEEGVVRAAILVIGCCLSINRTFPKDHHVKKLIQDFLGKLNGTPSHDVILKCGDLEVTAHRFVLCARSPVFYEELKNIKDPMIEYAFEDCPGRAPAVSLFVNFLYSAETVVCITPKVLEQLYHLAKSYQIPNLQDMCGQLMVDILDTKNACQFSETALTLEDDVLVDIGKNFIAEHFNEVFGLFTSGERLSFAANYPKLSRALNLNGSVLESLIHQPLINNLN